MRPKKIAIATISWARNKAEEDTLQRSLEQLSRLGYPVFITDGGSSMGFVSSLQALPQFHVFSAKGLWPQAKQSITEAAATGAEAIVYTEPDKLVFFAQHLQAMLASWNNKENFGVLLASRSAAGFSTFPPFQQLTETTINRCCGEIIGNNWDYCYGPFLFNPRLLHQLRLLPEDCGWGWRPFLFAMAHRLNLSVSAVVGDFKCPPDQQEEDAGEKIYRMKQLTQNINGLVQATSVAI